MHTCNSTLGDELEQYGIMRSKAKEKAGRSGSTPEFFGLTVTSKGYKTRFGEAYGLYKDPDVMLAVVAPEMESFDMLVAHNMPAAVRKADPATLRSFVSRILDDV